MINFAVFHLGNPFPGSRFPDSRESRTFFHSRITGNGVGHSRVKTGTVNGTAQRVLNAHTDLHLPEPSRKPHSSHALTLTVAGHGVGATLLLQRRGCPGLAAGDTATAGRQQVNLVDSLVYGVSADAGQ